MKRIELPQHLPLTMTLGEALAARRTTRDCGPGELSPEVLSTLLWAAAGQTSDDGRRTVPSTLDLRAVSAWVVRADGAWKYDAAANALEQSTDKDVRKTTTLYQFDYVKKAPVTVVFVADHVRAKSARPTAVFVDSGFLGQSIALAATSLGLPGCIRASFDHDKLAKDMNLPEGLEPILLFTVGNSIA